MGHKRIDETMLYVHVAANHARAIPETVTAAAAGQTDPDLRIVAMLGGRGKLVAKADRANEKTEATTAS
jgi:hypothetical protein